MGGSIRIARIAGIPIRAHWSFLLILPLLAAAFSQMFVQAARAAAVPPESLMGATWIWGLFLALALFASVLIHELSHAFYALAVGGKVRDVTLMMLGGVTHVSEPPRRSRDEAIMAAVGPLTSLALAGLAWVARLTVGPFSFNLAFALFYLAQVNLVLALFNMVPAFPMDGGRVLRAALTGRLGIQRATRVAVTLARVFSAAFVVFGLLTMNLFLVLIGFFVFSGASAEGRQVAIKEILERFRVREVMRPGAAYVDASESLESAAMRLVSDRRLAIAVVDGGQVSGVLAMQDVRKVPAVRRAVTSARAVARRVAPLELEDDAWTALRRLVADDLAELPVVAAGSLVGMVSRDALARTVEVESLAPAPGQIAPPIRT